jgi:hypothetical protein
MFPWLNTNDSRINSNRNFQNSSNLEKKNSNRMKQIMHYTIIDFPAKGQNFGEYISENPEKAAYIAFQELDRKNPINEDEFIVFTLLENETKNEYPYIGTKVELIEPIHVNYNNNSSKEYNYRYIVEKYNGDLDQYKINHIGGMKKNIRNKYNKKNQMTLKTWYGEKTQNFYKIMEGAGSCMSFPCKQGQNNNGNSGKSRREKPQSLQRYEIRSKESYLSELRSDVEELSRKTTMKQQLTQLNKIINDVFITMLSDLNLENNIHEQIIDIITNISITIRTQYELVNTFNLTHIINSINNLIETRLVGSGRLSTNAEKKRNIDILVDCLQTILRINEAILRSSLPPQPTQRSTRSTPVSTRSTPGSTRSTPGSTRSTPGSTRSTR